MNPGHRLDVDYLVAQLEASDRLAFKLANAVRALDLAHQSQLLVRLDRHLVAGADERVAARADPVSRRATAASPRRKSPHSASNARLTALARAKAGKNFGPSGRGAVMALTREGMLDRDEKLTAVGEGFLALARQLGW